MNSDSNHVVVLHGIQRGESEINYALSLRKKVAIDWRFDPRRKMDAFPVTRLDGSKFPITWQGKEPNNMVRAFLRPSANTNESKNR
jgi:hypothetical protein